MSKNSIKAIVKRVSIVLIMILGFIFVIFLPLWVYCVAYWIKGEKVTNRYIQLSDSYGFYVKNREFGLLGQHEDIILSEKRLRRIRFRKKGNVIYFHESGAYYEFREPDTLLLYSVRAPIDSLPDSFAGMHIKAIDLKKAHKVRQRLSNDQLHDLSINAIK